MSKVNLGELDWIEVTSYIPRDDQYQFCWLNSNLMHCGIQLYRSSDASFIYSVLWKDSSLELYQLLVESGLDVVNERGMKFL